MADNVLQATITADGSNFTKTLAQLEKQLKAFQAGLKNAGNAESFARLNRAAEATKSRIDALKKSGTEAGTALSKSAKGSNDAAFALTNLGRVAQDAPFGFIGIQNNLNPLLESFQRLKATTGTTGGALKALAGSLAGPAGVGFALSAVSSLLLVFGDRLFGASEAEKALDESSQKLAQTLASDLVSLTTVVGLIQNVSASTEDRQKALKFLNQEYDGYLKNIGIEEVTLANLTKAYDGLVESMLKQAVVKGLQEQIAKEVEKSAQTIVKLSLQQEEARQAQEKATKGQLTAEQRAANQRKQAFAQGQQYAGVQRDGYLAQQQLNQVTQAGISKFSDYGERIEYVKKQLRDSLAPALTLVKNFSDLGEVLTKPAKSSGDSIIQQAKALADQINDTTIRDVKFEVDPFDNEATQKRKAKEFIDKYRYVVGREAEVANNRRELPIKFNFGLTTDGLLADLSGTDLRDTIAKSIPKLKEGIEREAEKLTKTNPVLIQFRATLKGFYEFEKKMRDAAKELNEGIVSAFKNGIGGLAEGIGQVLAGEDLGKALFSVLGDLITQIGKALIQYGIIKAGLDKILAAGIAVPGLAAIALGAAAVAVGGLIKNTRVRGQRALGGSVTGGSPYLVGERGREVFVPNTSGRIVPNSALAGNVSGSGRTEVYGQFRIAGNDLVAAIASTSRSQRRLS